MLSRTPSCPAIKRAASCPAPASTPFRFYSEDNDDDCVVPHDGDCFASADEEENGDALLKIGDTDSPKSRGAAVHQLSRTKSRGAAVHQLSRTKSVGATVQQLSGTKSVGAAVQQLSGTKKYVPFGITKNLNKGSPRSPTSPTFGADLLKSPFQKLAPKRLEELFRGRNRANKEADQAGEEKE